MSIQEIINQIIEEEGKLQARIDSSPTSVSPNYRFSIYYQNLGDALLKLNRNHEAFQAYSRAAELQENYNKDGAIACYQKLISLNSNYIAAYEKLTQLQSSNWKNWLILSQKLEQKGETEKAIASYQEVLKLNTDYIEVYEKLTHLQPNNWKHWFVLGDKLAERGETERAINCYQKVIKLNTEYILAYEKLTQLQPSNWENWYVLGSKLEGKGETESAIASYQKVIGLNPEYLVAYEKLTQLQPSNWENWYVLGSKLEGKGETESAIAAYQKVISLNPEYLIAYEKLTQLQPSNWENWYVLGKFHSKYGRLEEAITYYQKVVNFNNHPEGLYNLALLEQEMNNINKAIFCCKRLIEINPNLAKSHSLLGNLLLGQGKREEAMLCYYQANQIKFRESKQQMGLVPILVSSLPKSGTIYIRDSLYAGLSMPSITNFFDFPDVDLAAVGASLQLKSLNLFMNETPFGLGVAHINPNERNLFMISLMLDRLVVNIRDPRQAIISWINHASRGWTDPTNRNNLNHPVILYRQFKHKKSYLCNTYKEQIDYEIETGFLPYSIEWIEGWLTADEDPFFKPKILFSKFEDLATDPMSFYKSILDFYEIEESKFKFPVPPEFKQGTHYRKGKIDEWREVFTPEQKEKATKMIPQRLLDKFGWPTE